MASGSEKAKGGSTIKNRTKAQQRGAVQSKWSPNANMDDDALPF